jgi:2-polyprenyl-6-methoxyphenol hydroxylase-like FAD-dependent oxidoreductase
MRASLSFLSDPCGYEALTLSEQKEVIRNKFCDAGWIAPRILATVDQSPDIYFDSIGQVKAPTFSRGRVALLGDAAYCPSPISGMGTSLAFVGAYILAGELARCSDYREAFLNYEKLMRPYVDKAQQLPPGSPRLAHPKSKTGIWLFHTMLRLAYSPAVGAISRRLSTPKAEQIVLPEYAGN